MIEVIPAIDLIEGKCVRLLRGDFSKKRVYDFDPVEIAKRFEQVGVRRIHVVDLEGAKSGEIKNLKTLERIARATGLRIDFGGGIRSASDVEKVFRAGASQVNLGTAVVKQKDEVFRWGEKYGRERFLIGFDVRNGKVAVNGWRRQTQLELITVLEEMVSSGEFEEFFVTDISRDGSLKGVNFRLYEKILSKMPRLKLIASGGVYCIEDIKELERIGCCGVIVGKAIYEAKISLEDLKCLQNA